MKNIKKILTILTLVVVMLGGFAPVVNATLNNGGGGSASLGTTATTTIGNLNGEPNPTVYSGSDIGAKINTAYGVSNFMGTSILVPPATSSDRFYFSTGISANTDNKPLLLRCYQSGSASNSGSMTGTVLWYTGTTGTSTRFNTNDYVTGNSSGVENCNIQGTNGTTARITDGVYRGGTNGAFTTHLEGVHISGFGTGVVDAENTSMSSITNSVINFNGRLYSYPDRSGANCENMKFINNVFADANNQAGGNTSLKGIYMQESGNCQMTWIGNSIDNAQVYQDQFGGTNNQWNWIGNHFENPSSGTYSMVESRVGATNVINNFVASDMMNDTVGGQPDQIKVEGTVNMIAFSSNANSPVTTATTRIVNALASTTEVNWVGLTCKGAQATTNVYGNVPCSPFGIGSDRGQPSLYVASTTSRGVGIVGIATSTTNMSMASPAVLNIGVNPATTNSSTTVNMKRLQFQGESASGAVTCAYIVGTAWVVQAGACNN